MSAIACMSARRIDGEYVQIRMYSSTLATATNEHARTLRDSLNAALGDGEIDRDGLRAQLDAAISERDAAQERAKMASDRADEAMSRLAVTESERDELAHELADAAGQRDQAIRERDATKALAAMDAYKLREALARISDAEKERDLFSDMLSDAAGQRDQAIRERDEARAAAAEAVRALRDAVDSAPELTGSQIDIAAHPLYPILISAIQQAMYGKGERHGGCSTPFLDQPWRDLAQAHGRGGLTFQAEKKIREAASRGLTGEPFEREVLGAVVYIGMAILWDRESLAAAPSEDVPI